MSSAYFECMSKFLIFQYRVLRILKKDLVSLAMTAQNVVIFYFSTLKPVLYL